AVHDDPQRSRLVRGGDGRRGILRARDVAGGERSAEFGCHGSTRGRREVHDRDGCPGGGERPRGGESKAGYAANDEGARTLDLHDVLLRTDSVSAYVVLSPTLRQAQGPPFALRQAQGPAFALRPSTGSGTGRDLR